MEVSLTHEADFVLCTIYQQYLKRRSEGINKSTAIFFGSSHDLENIIPQMPFEDIEHFCRDLGKAKILNIQYADNICNKIELSDNGIIYMEKRFQNQLVPLVDFIAKLKALLFPFL